MERFKRALSLVLCFVMVCGLMPMNVFAAEGETHYLMFATDRHANTSVIGEIINNMEATIGDNQLEYLALGGDMVGSGNDHPEYNSSTVLGEATGATDSLSAANVDIVAGIHDMNVTDDAGIVLPYQGGGAQIYAGDGYYVYGVEEYCISEDSNESIWSAQAQAFVDWANGDGIDKSAVIFVSSHYPLHANRDDNDGAYYWHQALNTVATGGDDTVERDIVFFHGHNHTVDKSEYVYDVGETMEIQNGSSTVSEPIYYTYATAGYLNQNSNATLVTLTDEQIVLEKYTTNGSEPMTTVTRAVTETVPEETTAPTETTEPETTEPEATEPEATEPETTVPDEQSMVGDVSDATVPGYDNTVSTTVWKLTDTITANNTYLIVNTNAASTSAHAMGHSGTTPADDAVVVYNDGTNTYILDSDVDSTSKWTFEGSSGSWTPKNGDYYLTYTFDSSSSIFGTSYSNFALAVNTTAYTWATDGNNLRFQKGSNNRYGLTYSNGWTLGAATGSWGSYTYPNVYFYAEDTITTGVSKEEATYGIDITVNGAASQAYTVTGVESTTTLALGTAFTSTVEGQLPSGGTYSWSVGSDNGVASVAADGTVSFTGKAGQELICVSYTWTENGEEYTISNYIVLTAQTPVYSMAIDAPSVPTVKTGADLNLTAKAYKDSTAISDAEIIWTSSDNTIATVDENGVVTGVAEGTVTMTAVWTDPAGEEHTDSVVLNVVNPTYAVNAASETTQIKVGATGTVTAAVTADSETVEGAAVTWSSSNEAVATVDANGVVTGVGAGDVVITASYTDPFGNILTDSVNISVVDAVYTLDLCEKQDDGTTVSITKPIVVKDVDTLIANGTNTHSVWAVITADGEDIGTLSEAQLEKLTFVSSNEKIATVDKTTGVVTFVGGEGTVQITAYYEYADGKSVSDMVTFSVSASTYTIPSDGTNDFPNYPDEGAIRFDKNATAVGTFSQTGIAKVELSMTGVPYSTGSEIDVVVMLDMTGSMSDNGMEAAEEATVAFVEKIVKNEDGSYNENRVAVYAFNSGSSSPYELVSLDSITSDAALATANTAIRTASDKQTSGGTPFDEAAKKCYDVLQAAKTDDIGNDRQQFCVFMSDGGPTAYRATYNNTNGYLDISNSGSGASGITTYFSGYNSTSSSSWSFTLPTEYYTDLMKADNVTVYTVGLLLQNKPSNPSPYSSMSSSTYDSETDSLTSIGSHYYFTSRVLKQMASSEDKYIDIFNVDNASKATAAFEAIAKSIREAAKDVIVADEITDKYTMVFEAPNAEVDGYDGSQEYYIEVVDYALTPVYKTDANGNQIVADYQRGTSTSLIRVYLAMGSNGKYYAASDNAGTAFAAPTFTTDAIGSMHYWTTTAPTGDADTGIQVTVDGTTYYFVPAGNGTHNITDGAYASGTLTKQTITKSDGTTSTSSTSQDLIIVTEYFVYNAETRMLYWTAEKLNNSELALSYFLYLNESGGWVTDANEQDPGTYDTNVEATITYTNFQDTRCQQKFPVPQMTWKGAQVSYVFYLVNEDGDPVNRAGRVVPFSEAVYVTNVHKYAITWNDAEETESLSAERLAKDLVPEVYRLYDTAAYYEIHAFESNEQYADYFLIKGTDGIANEETTKVFNTKADTNHRYAAHGSYSNAATYTTFDENGNAITNTTDTVTTGFDYCNTTVAFAVVWTPGLVKDTVVVDYGLDVVVNVSANDSMASGVVGVRSAAPAGVIMGSGTYDAAKASYADVVIGTGDSKVAIGTAAVESLTSVRFSMNKDSGMEFWKEAVFYYEADVNFYNENNELVTSSMYTSVTVIPATTIYYEDSFVDYKVYDAATFEELTNTWTFVGETDDSATQDTDRPGDESLLGDDANNLYGYDSAYTECSEYSLGGAMKLNVNEAIFGEAVFNFYGTGFDVISLTSNTTGTIIVDIYPYEMFWKDGVATYEGELSSYIVDTYYGYTYTSVEVDNDGDGVNDSTEMQWVAVDTNDPSALYQVPVMKVQDLEYRHYTAVVTVAYDAAFDHEQYTDGTYDFYLDAVRIYDPANDGENSTTIQNAYVADDEGWPSYAELRNLLIEAKDFNADTTVNGVIMIDSNKALDTTVNAEDALADYTSYGPNNELYLAPGQAVAFELNAGDSAAMVQLGMKSVGFAPSTGREAQVKIYDASVSAETVAARTIETATDMYYDITALNGKTVVIANVGTTEGAILSLTNIKVTYSSAPTVSAASLDDVATVSSETAEAAVWSMRAAPVEEEPEEIIPEVFEPETFSVYLNKTTVKVGGSVRATIYTSEDVDHVVVNGETVTDYYNSWFSGYRIWSVSVAAEELGTMTIDVNACNSDGAVSETITKTVNVTQYGWFFGW